MTAIAVAASLMLSATASIAADAVKAVEYKKADPAQFYNVKPVVKSLGIKNPTRGLYVGNSYTYSLLSKTKIDRI